MCTDSLSVRRQKKKLERRYIRKHFFGNFYNVMHFNQRFNLFLEIYTLYSTDFSLLKMLMLNKKCLV